ncbi:DUF342 domain-containing protein [Vibrio sp. LaRot3]|uniref:DUF342 domain-containing protein n=1 Tax=Vibrio sp. LaRot3 TaxID=2998829 RepID=UPI0022CE07A7|nr:FapA family protein [Vibrio sp. LaRot3]MDA0149823.1 FapA family protein [Vibrio sp. LaRot3]
MWSDIVARSEDEQQVVAQLPKELTLSADFDQTGLADALKDLGADKFFLIEEEVLRFLTLAKEGKSEGFQGIIIAEQRDAAVELILSEGDMLATMKVTGAYGGKALSGPTLIHALAKSTVTKGINKLALKKVLAVSHKLAPGEEFSQAVAAGKNPIHGRDARFIPLVKDASKQVLAPVEDETGKVDMLNLGETISVVVGQPLMRYEPPTKGTPGITVQGHAIPATEGKEGVLKEGKGSAFSEKNPNVLVATVAGMPILHERSVDVDEVLVVPSIGVATGHVRFKGSVIVRGNIESDMVVRATGTITVGGFIESADVQAQGDIEVAKGIIGHNVSDDEQKSCVVKAGGSIKANYAQFSFLQAGHNIDLSVHCLNNEIRCGNQLTVSDEAGRQGTLSGGLAKVGGKVTCVNLGVEGDTPTHVHAFARYQMHKDRQAKFKEQYELAQEATMNVIRKEIEFKKLPKAERSEEKQDEIDKTKVAANTRLEKVKAARDEHAEEFEGLLEENIIEVTSKVYTHVTVQFGDEKVVTKRVHGASLFTFNQFEIKCSSMFDDQLLEEEA